MEHIPFYHVRHFLDQAAAAYFGLSGSYRGYPFRNPDLAHRERQLADRLGISPADKFRKLQQAWLDARVPIPLAWLRELGIRLENLEACVNQDAADVRLALDQVSVEQYFIPVRPFTRLYRSLGVALPVAEALPAIQARVDELAIPQAFSLSGHLLLCEFRPGIPWRCSEARPELLIRNNHAILTGYQGDADW